MLSADVPEFIPKALRADGQAATRTNDEENGSSSLATEALQTKPDLADESPSSTSEDNSADVASYDVNSVEEHHLSDNEGLAKESLPCKRGMVLSSIPNEESNILNSESNFPVLEVDQDAFISSELEDGPAPPAVAAASLPVTQGDGESPVIASSLRATSAEFFPAGMYLGYNSPTDSPGPQMSYTGSPSPHNSPGFMYPNRPPFYYEPNGYTYCCDSNWTHDLDYNQGFYNPMVNAGHYSAGEYFVPNGGYMFEGGDGGYPQQPLGAGHLVEPTYFDPNLAAEYSGGFVDVPGPGAIGIGGGAAGGATGGATGGAPGGVPGGYNKKYPNKNRQKRPPDHGGGRGAGGGRQPSNEMRICGQTGELTLGKRRPQGTTSQGGRGSARQQDKVQASTIISNVKNWPTLNMGKVEKEKSSISPSANDGAPVVTANVHDNAAVSKVVELPVAKCIQAPPAISFSSIAKKKNEIAEPATFSSKQSNPGPSTVKTKKDLHQNKTLGDKTKKGQYTPVSGVKTDSSKKSCSNEATIPKSETEWTFKGKQTNSAQASPIVVENLQQEVIQQPNSAVNLTHLTKSAKKKAKKNKKVLAAAAVSGLIEESPIESNEITMSASPIGMNTSEDVVLPAIVDEEPSVSVKPEQSKTVAEWPNKDVSSTAPKYSKNHGRSQPNAKTHMDKKLVSDDIENKAVTINMSSSMNSTVKLTNVSVQRTVDSSSTEETKKPETTLDEFTWVTVGKRSKSKKASLPKELDQISLSQNKKSYKGNSTRNKQNAPQGSTVLAITNIANQEIAPKVGSSSSFSTKVVVDAPKDGSSSNYCHKPKVVVSVSKDGSSNSSNAKPKVVSKTETSAQILSLERDPKKELDKVESLPETTVTSTTVEHKKRDPNDPEVQKIMKQREIRKENIKREKKLNREAAALEKRAMAKKDSRISVLPAVSPKSAGTQVAAPESFAIKAEEYPSLGAKKSPKSQIDKSAKNLKKEAVNKINGIIQKYPELVGTNVVETKSQDESDEVALSNVWATGSKSGPAITTPSQHSIKSISTISVPSSATPEESISVRQKVLSYSLAAASVPAAVSRDLKTRSGSTAPAEAVKKGTVTVKAKKNVHLLARSKQVKYSDKLEIDLRNLLVIKPSRLKRGQASSIASQTVASRTARRTTGARPVRVLTTSVGKQPRIKGQKLKVPTAIQRYKKLNAQHRQDLLLLLADLKRRQDAEQKTDINTEGFREEISSISQTSSSDLSNSTNNTRVPDVYINSSLLSENAATCFNSSVSGLADTSNSADDAVKSSNKKRKRNKKSSNLEVPCSTAAENSSTKSLQVVAVSQDMPEDAEASAVVAVEQEKAVIYKPLTPAEAKEIADRLADELQKMQGTIKQIVKTNVITRELNDLICVLLQDIVRFQRRSYFHDQIKAKAKRRFVSGIKEVHHKLHKIQLLVMAQDVGKAIPMVADSAAALLKDAEAQQVPVVFALNRRRIGRLTRKEAGYNISCVGILNFQGAEDSVKEIMFILPELKRRQQLINDSKQGATITNSILEEEEEDSSSLACDGDSGPSSATVTSSSSSNQSTPAKVSAASAHVSKSGSQVMRGKNGIRQMTGEPGKLSGAAGLGTTPFTTVAASLEVNEKIVSILKGQENHISTENQTS